MMSEMYETWRTDDGRPVELIGIYPDMGDVSRAIKQDAAQRGPGVVYTIEPVKRAEVKKSAEDQ